MFGAAPGDVANGVTGLHLAGEEGTLVMSPTDEQRLVVVSTLDRIGGYHPAGRVAPGCTSRVESTDFQRRGRCCARIYNYILMLSNAKGMFGIIDTMLKMKNIKK